MPMPKKTKLLTPSYLPTVFQDKKGEWRWRLDYPNGNIVACSGESYKNKAHAVRMVRRLFPLLAF